MGVGNKETKTKDKYICVNETCYRPVLKTYKGPQRIFQMQN
jgi:hypothetical protein